MKRSNVCSEDGLLGTFLRSAWNYLYGGLSAFEQVFHWLIYELIRYPQASDGAIERILLAKFDSIGDFMMFTPILRELRSRIPQAHIVLFVRTAVINLAETCPYVDEVWHIDERTFRWNIFEKIRWAIKLSAAQFTIAINCRYSVNFTNLDCLVGWSKAPRRIAFECIDKFRKRTTTKPYLTELIPSDSQWKFEIDRNFDILKHLGFAPPTNRATEMWVREGDRKTLDRKAGNREAKYAIIAPASQVKLKIWDQKNFVSVIETLSGKFSFHWYICGSRGEWDLCNQLDAALKNRAIGSTNLAGMLTLREFGFLAEGAAFYFGNDTGPMHIAAAMGIYTIAILGGGHYGRFYPYPDNPKTIAVTNKLPCYNCDWRCILEEPECITRISVENATESIVNILTQHNELGAGAL